MPHRTQLFSIIEAAGQSITRNLRLDSVHQYKGRFAGEQTLTEICPRRIILLK